MVFALNIYRRLLGAQVRGQMQYRASFFFEFFGAILITLFEYASLALVFDRFGSLQGWSLGEVAFLYGLSEISFGVMNLLFGGFDPGTFGIEIRRGTFDQYLLRPINITLQVLSSRFVLRRIGKIGVGLGIFITALNMTSIHWNIAKIIYLPMVVLGITFFFGSLFMVGSTITFWTVESIEVINIFTYGGSFMISHPMHIYPNWLRRIFTYVIPAAFLNYYPALYFLDKPDPFNLPAAASFAAPLAGIIFIFISTAFWLFGIQHYQSTGT
ncbi:MAG: ABC-2 family transporter protein [Chloroflexota bacterium]